MSLLDTLAEGFADLDANRLRRQRRVADTPCSAHMTVDGRPLVAFASNDYLGLAAHPALADALAEGARRYGAGSGGSHLLGGHSRAHAELEDALAEFVGGFVEAPRGLYFGTGYMANLAVLGTLGNSDTTIFSDVLNHASLIDGSRLARADVKVYPHADVDALDAMLQACETPHKLIASDTVFSMDGDVAPLQRLAALAERHGAWLVLDDAHGFGVLGREGRGALDAAGIGGGGGAVNGSGDGSKASSKTSSEHSPSAVGAQIIYVGTLGKAAGVAGAFVVAHAQVIEWLIQRARPYIFTTAAPPAVAHAVSASLKLIAGPEGAARRAHLQRLIERTRTVLRSTRYQPVDSHTAIQPLVIGSNQAALAVAAQLDAAGLWVPAVRPPTVPVGSARLRLSLSAAHTDADLDRLAHAFAELREIA